MADDFAVLPLRIGRILVAERDQEHCTYEISKKIGVNRGNTQRVLRRFEHRGWLVNRIGPGAKTTPRVLYTLTETGISAITDALRPFQIVPLST